MKRAREAAGPASVAVPGENQEMCQEGQEPASSHSSEGVLAHRNFNLPRHPSVTYPKKAIQT